MTSGSAVILVASHDDGQRARLVDLVSHRGHRALEAGDAVQALAVAARSIPDLIIADAALPHRDEAQLPESLKQSPDTIDPAADRRRRRRA